ncbi:MAG TPA: tRNA lysidine(34) synthetase TilS [Prolixibacteraceae bacterium]|nr:tRNA lysidine(34) synthetase TilS [Prolixibacteraceae bacterium]
MFNRFLENIKEKKLLNTGGKVLLAVSGGIDSMVMLYLFEKSGFDYGIVHCNFQLRGDESDRDEEFVRTQVLIHGVPAYFKRFDTEEYAQINGISIEMAARELRYEYFEKIRIENGYNFIATAHHSDDLIETFFLNLTRKTGIKGLTGIKDKSGKIIRPMLFASRADIEKYASEQYLEFREDSTNSEVVYQRNFLRHKILPLFSTLNPSFKKNLLASIENLKDAEAVYSGFFETEKQKVIEKATDSQIINIEKLKQSPHPRLLLFEILSDLNFNSNVVEEVFQSLNTESGKQFYSKTHRLVKDREKLFITEFTRQEDRIFYLEANDVELFEPVDITIEKLPAKDFKIRKEPNIACLDLDKLEFPLLVRKWQEGDYFQPLGMTGYKKLSDFFIDEKVPVHKKENTWLLCSGEKIVWVMGMRIDNRFKINPKTNRVLKIEIKKLT